MTNISRLAVVLGLLFSIISISTSGVAQPPPPPYTHYKIINAEVQGQLVVGAPVTIVAVIQDMGNVESSSGSYEIHIDGDLVDSGALYLSSGDSTTVRYTHYFDSSGTHSINIVTCSELGSCPDDIASGTISIKDSSAPPQPPPLPPSPPSNQPPWATIAAPSEVKVGETFWVEIIDYGDDQPNPLMFEYDFGDGGRVRSPGAERHSYSQAGTYTIRGRVCDPQGACSNTNSVTVRVISNQQTPPPSQQYIRFTGTLTNVSEAESDIGYWLLYTVRPDSSYGLGSEVVLRAGPISCPGGRGQVDVYINDIGSRVEVYSTTDGDVSCAPAYIRKISSPPPPNNGGNRPPSVTLSCYPLNLTPNDTLSCEANASDPDRDTLTYEWFLNEKKLTNISSSSNRVYWDKPQPGSYTLRVVVSDNRGGTSQSSVSFTVQEIRQNKPPIIQSIEYDPSSPLAGQLVRFWANAYDENGRIVAYEWDFGARPYQAEEQAEYAWQNPGTYRVCLTVYDNDGASTRKCRDITVQQAKTLLPPRANFTFSPSNPKVGETVYFKDQSTDPDGRIVGRGWIVDDQFFSEDPNPTITFSTPGTHTVCLRVADNDYLFDEQCTTITVRPEDKPKQSPVARFTMTAPNGQTAQENQTLNLTVPRGGKVSINFSASNSYDPDGGGIRSYEWWINGTPVSQSSQFQSPELGANTPQTPQHRIHLRVTDDEGQTAEVGATVVITEQQTPVINPSLRVEGSTSSTKQQGQSFNLSGSGYTPDKNVSIFVMKDDKLIDVFQKQADRNGNISWTWPTSCDTPTGTYELQAIDETTNAPSNTITEIVTSNPACGSSTAVAPKLWVDNKESSERKQRETFVLTGSGFTPNKSVRRFVQKPGATPTEISPINADNEGNIPAGVWQWTPECTDPIGTYKVWAIDAESGKQSKAITEIVIANPAKCGGSSGKVPVIFIPGIVGTELYEDSKRLWPDVACFEFVPWNHPEDDLRLNSGKVIKAGNVIEDRGQYGAGCLNQLRYMGYGNFFDDLKRAGYEENRSLFSLPYDWRKDLKDIATSLQQKISEVLEKTGSKQVDIIAHSMGGLVVRYYLNNLERNSNKVRRLIFAGTPQHGAPKAFKALVWGDPDYPFRFFFNRTTAKKLAETFPSVYQLLPTRKFFALYRYIIDIEGPRMGGGDPNVALTETYYENGTILRINNKWLVKSAMEFHDSMGPNLNFSGATLIIAGYGQKTIGYFWCKGMLSQCQDEGYTDGDGTVPLGSAIELTSNGPLSKFCAPVDHSGVMYSTLEMVRFLSDTNVTLYNNCPTYEPNPIGSIGTGDAVGEIPPSPTTKTIEQAIASLVPNDPPDVANPDLVIGDIEMTKALGLYEKQQPVPNTDGKVIDDLTMLRLQDLWISRRPVSSSASLTTSETRLRREWGLLTRQLDRRTIEFIALGFDVRSIRVEIFNLQGQRVFAEEAPSNRLTFRDQDSREQRLANGVYLYVVTVRNHDGTTQRSNVRKLVLRR